MTHAAPRAAPMNIFRHIGSKADLEREYSPSSCVDGDLAPFLHEYSTRSARARATLEGWRSHAYGPHPAEVLDVFPAPSAAAGGPPRPTLIWFHGGYWQQLSKDEQSYPAIGLNQHDLGYNAVGYGLAPEATLEQMVERCRRAVAWVVQNGPVIGTDPAALYLGGSSAGAHLAAMVALTGSRSRTADAPLRGLILLSGVYDLRPIPLTYINDAVAMSEEQALCNSPRLLMEASQGDLPPALLAYGDQETAEFKRQSRSFAGALARRGVHVELCEIAGRNHFDLPLDLSERGTAMGDLVLRWLAEPPVRRAQPQAP